jgi:hypothetical protein
MLYDAGHTFLFTAAAAVKKTLGTVEKTKEKEIEVKLLTGSDLNYFPNGGPVGGFPGRFQNFSFGSRRKCRRTGSVCGTFL